MRFQETETVELKSIVMDDIKKEIIAFANCDGGTVYVGVSDDGTVLGVENADECALQISNMVPLLADDGEESERNLRLHQSGAGGLPAGNRAAVNLHGCGYRTGFAKPV